MCLEMHNRSALYDIYYIILYYIILYYIILYYIILYYIISYYIISYLVTSRHVVSYIIYHVSYIMLMFVFHVVFL